MPLADPQGSRAVLIGSVDYDFLDPLPAVANNLDRLSTLLTDPEVWGLPAAHCVVLKNPGAAVDVIDAVRESAHSATEALLVYFAGHGLLDEKTADLFLALPGSDKERLYRAVRYDDVRREVMDPTLTCPSKVVVLDCCYSGRAMFGGMGDQIQMADQARIDGTFLLTASAETKIALAPAGEHFTAFTGELIKVLDEGFEGGPALLDLDSIYWRVRGELEAKGRPIPQQRARNDGRAIMLARNRHGTACASSPAPPPRPRRQPPAGWDRMLTSVPREVVAAVAELRGTGQVQAADEILLAAGAVRAGQEVAAIAADLRRSEQLSDLAPLLTGASERPPRAVLTVLRALRTLDLDADADAVLAAAAGREESDVAIIANDLRKVGWREDLDVLLNAAIGVHGEPAALIRLVGALWSTGQQQDAERVLDRAAGRMTPDESVNLADGLREAGRDGPAFRLYAASAEMVARRGPAEVATLVAAMRSTGSTGHADELVAAAIDGASSSSDVVELLDAFWTHELSEDAGRMLDHVREHASAAEIAQVERLLRSRGRTAEALRLCCKAVAGRPAEFVIVVVAALLAAGRPIDANRVVERAWSGRSSADASLLIAGLHDLSAGAAVNQALASTAAGPVQDLVAIINGLDRAGSTNDVATLLELVVVQPVTRLAEILVHMAGDPEQRANTLLLPLVVTVRQSADLAELFSLLHTPAPDQAGRFVAAVGRGPSGPEKLGVIMVQTDLPFLTVIAAQQPQVLTALIVALCASAYEREFAALVARAGSLPGDDLARLISGLRAASRAGDADPLLHGSVAQMSVRGMSLLVTGLQRLGHPADAAHLTRAFRDQRPYDWEYLDRMLRLSGQPVDSPALYDATQAKRGWRRRR